MASGSGKNQEDNQPKEPGDAQREESNAATAAAAAATDSPAPAPPSERLQERADGAPDAGGRNPAVSAAAEAAAAAAAQAQRKGKGIVAPPRPAFSGGKPFPPPSAASVPRASSASGKPPLPPRPIPTSKAKELKAAAEAVKAGNLVRNKWRRMRGEEVDLKEVFDDLMKECKPNMEDEPEGTGRELKDQAKSPTVRPQEAKRSLWRKFLDRIGNSNQNDIFSFLRLVAAVWICSHSEEFEPLVLGLKIDYTLRDWCLHEVIQRKVFADHLQITALVRALGVPLRVEYLFQEVGQDLHSVQGPQDDTPRSTCSPRRHQLPPDRQVPCVTMLYTNEHYAIVYPNHASNFESLSQQRSQFNGLGRAKAIHALEPAPKRSGSFASGMCAATRIGSLVFLSVFNSVHSWIAGCFGKQRWPMPPSEFSWLSVMGEPILNTDGSCTISAATMCIEAQHRLAFERLYRRGSFTFKAKVPAELKKSCYKGGIWNSEEGAVINEILHVIAKKGGVLTQRVPNNIKLPISGFHHIAIDDIGGYQLMRIIYAHGPLIGGLWAAFGDYERTTGDRVYRGRKRELRRNGDGEGHAVVCFAYKFDSASKELRIRIMDNHTSCGPLRWILFDAFDEFVLPLVSKPVEVHLLRRKRKKEEHSIYAYAIHHLAMLERKLTEWLIGRELERYYNLPRPGRKSKSPTARPQKAKGSLWRMFLDRIGNSNQNSTGPHVNYETIPMAAIITHYRLLEMVAGRGVEFHSNALNLRRAYSAFRPVHGDGECFYRSFIFSYLEQVLDRQDTHEEHRLLVAVKEVARQHARLGWLSEFSSSHKAFKKLIKKVMKWKRPSRWKHVPTTSSYRKEKLLAFFSGYDRTNDIFSFLRLVAAVWICSHSEDFEPLVPGLKKDYTLRDWCLHEVIQRKVFTDHVQITALIRALGVQLRVEYLFQEVGQDLHTDQGPQDDMPLPRSACWPRHHHQLPPDHKVPRVTLLYTHEHYGIMYPDHDGAGSQHSDKVDSPKADSPSQHREGSCSGVKSGEQAARVESPAGENSNQCTVQGKIDSDCGQ